MLTVYDRNSQMTQPQQDETQEFNLLLEDITGFEQWEEKLAVTSTYCSEMYKSTPLTSKLKIMKHWTGNQF